MTSSRTGTAGLHPLALHAPHPTSPVWKQSHHDMASFFQELTLPCTLTEETMQISELRQSGGHAWVSRAKTPFLVRQCLLQLQLLSSEQIQLPLDLGKMSLYKKVPWDALQPSCWPQRFARRA
eukprot:5306216-Amphidinium_carterae.2